MAEPEQKDSVVSEPVQVQPVIQEAKAPLLRDETGTALPIFVDPNELDSARLCRTIKVCKQLRKHQTIPRTSYQKHGGVNARQPGQAKIILVKHDAYTGLQFVRDWSDSVATLDYRWVEKCITQGRVLGEADGWGGCLLKYDGKPIVPPTMDGEGPSTHVEMYDRSIFSIVVLTSIKEVLYPLLVKLRPWLLNVPTPLQLEITHQALLVVIRFFLQQCLR